MKTFEDLEFKPHTTGPGLHGIMFFPNGYGISVVRFKIGDMLSYRGGYGSYTSNEEQWEVAVLKGNEEEWSLTYNTPITDDVLGWQSEYEVTEIMKQIQQLKPVITLA